MKLMSNDFGNMGLFYAFRDDDRLGEHFAGMKMIDAARMMYESSHADGMIVYGKGDKWLVIRGDDLREPLGLPEYTAH